MNALVIAFVADVSAPRLRRRAAEQGQRTDMIICADSGSDAALAWGLRPTLALGDMDSIAPDTLAQLRAEGVPVQVYPPEKDETDMELALREAAAQGATHITILGGVGGRLDHTLGNIGLLAASWLSGIEVRMETETEQVFVIHAGERATIDGQAGDIVSLVPLTTSVDGIRTNGLYYPLNDESLLLGLSRGISNVLLGSHATIAVADGVLLIIHQVVE